MVQLTYKHPENISRFSACGAGEALTVLLSSYGGTSATVAEHACGLLSGLASASAPLRVKLGAAGVCEAVIIALGASSARKSASVAKNVSVATFD